jgi:hypothetical protein
VGRREQRCHHGGVASTDEDGFLGADRIQDGDDVVHLLLEGRQCDSPVGEPGASSVELDEASDSREAFQVAAGGRVFPYDFDVRVRAPDEEDVGWAVADFLVGEVDVAVVGVADLGDVDHGCCSRTALRIWFSGSLRSR